MNIKALIKQFTPLIFLHFYRRVRGNRYIWNGIYDSYASVPSSGDGFNSEYVRQELACANEILRAVKRDRAVPTKLSDENAFLPLLASIVRPRNSERLRIIDFGGALGFGYMQLLAGAPSCSVVDYHVVELEWACLEGKRLFSGDGRIQFHRALPDRLSEVDIVYSCGALQYVEDYAELLRKLCSYRARYLFLSDVPTGTFSTFATAQQNIEGTIVATWFFNFGELVRLIEAERYSLVFKTAVVGSYNQDNFPPSYRLDAGRYCALLFECSEHGSSTSARF